MSLRKMRIGRAGVPVLVVAVALSASALAQQGDPVPPGETLEDAFKSCVLENSR